MDLFLSLAAKVSNDYGFSALAVALLMVLFYWIVTNEKLIAVADRVFNKRLTSTNLFRFIRLSIVLVFVFSLLVILLAFLTPILVKTAENRALKLVLEARGLFDRKEYGSARDHYQLALAVSPDQPTADDIRGMVTATYYGQNLHKEGLEFLCEQYKYKAVDSRSFLFNAHAHLRAISVANGSDEAERIARSLREKCGRPDFSEFWAHVPFAMMESLRTGRLRTAHAWKLSSDSKQRLTDLLETKRKAAMSKQIPFADFVLYFTDRFDELIDELKESPIRDIALFDAAVFSNTSAKMSYLKRLIEDYPKSSHFVAAITVLTSTLVDIGKRDEALFYVAKIKDGNATESASLIAIAPTVKALSKLIREGALEPALKLSNDACSDFEKNQLTCIKVLRQTRDKVQLAIGYASAKSSSHICVDMQSNIRKLAKIDEKRVDLDWLHATRSLLVGCLERTQGDPDDYARSLYLIAAISRQVGDYKTSIDYLNRFTREISDHNLLDDVLTEIGYHKLIVERDWSAAAPYFEKVMSEFSDRNAYDNALWWYAYGLKSKGDFASAARIYAQIAALQVKSRFSEWSNSERQGIVRLTKLPPFIGVVFRANAKSDEGLFVARVDAEAPSATVVAVGDRLVRVCGRNVNTIELALQTVSSLESSSSCRVLYLRGRTLVRLIGGLSGDWKADKLELSTDQLRDLAFGAGQF